MCYDLYDLGNKGLVWGDLVVPGLHEVPQDDGDDGIKLKVDIVPARQGWEEFVDGRRGGPAAVAGLLRTQHAADQLSSGAI